MSSIQEILASILQAVYGKDVRQAIHDGVEMAYNKADNAETSAAAAAEAASGSQNSAAASAQAAANSASSASNSANQAEQYKDEAFHTTPAGYEAFVGEVNSSLDYLASTGVKNIFPTKNYKNDNRGTWNSAHTEYTHNGVTFTFNYDADGNVESITANGTATGGDAIICLTLNSSQVFYTLSYPTGSYKLTGCPVSGSSSTYYVLLYKTSPYVQYKEVGTGVIFNGGSVNYAVNIFVTNGITVDNVTFKPMITVADAPNSDYAHYVPFAQSNAALTEKITNIGHYLKTIPNAVSVPSAEDGQTLIGSLSLTKGIWLVFFHGNWLKNANGARQISIRGNDTTPTGWGGDRDACDTVLPIPNDQTFQSIYTFRPSSVDKTYYFYAAQNSGSSISFYGAYGAIYLGDL